MLDVEWYFSFTCSDKGRKAIPLSRKKATMGIIQLHFLAAVIAQMKHRQEDGNEHSACWLARSPLLLEHQWFWFSML